MCTLKLKGRQMMNQRLQQIIQNLDVIQESYPEDACVVLADTVNTIAVLPGKKMNLQMHIGPLMEGMVTYKALQTKKKVREERGAELFGVPYVATAIPIREEDKIIGVLTSIISNEKLDTLRKGAEQLNAMVQEMSTTSEEMAKTTDNTVQRLHDVSIESNNLTKDIQSIVNVMNLIKEMALKSRILGLNAGIESARVGEAGKGFAVVATEIKKMAESSEKSAKEIFKQLESMKDRIERVNDAIHKLTIYTEEHSSSMEEFRSAIEYVASTALQLNGQSIIECQ
jgi:hypothetical protein